MSDNIIQLNEDLIKNDLKELVRNSVEETLNALLDKEADDLISAQKYERSPERQGYRSGHYKRNFQTTSGEVELKMPKLKGIPFETAIIERYRRRPSYMILAVQKANYAVKMYQKAGFEIVDENEEEYITLCRLR